MAKKKTKVEAQIKNKKEEAAIDVAGTNQKGEDWNIKSLEVESKTKLEDDLGDGKISTLRFFDFAANPEAFKDKNRWPTAQELFNSHLYQIQQELWKDEWQVVDEVEPRLLLSKDRTHYRIIVVAQPARGSLLSSSMEAPKTLSQIAHDATKNS
jgi:hypothetical protein